MRTLSSCGGRQRETGQTDNGEATHANPDPLAAPAQSAEHEKRYNRQERFKRLGHGRHRQQQQQQQQQTIDVGGTARLIALPIPASGPPTP